LYYGWIIVIASVAIGIINWGIRNSFGIFFNSLETEFGLSRAATSGIFSIYMLLCGAVAPLGGWTLDKYGPKKVCLVMSFFIGLSLLASSQVHETWQIYITYSFLLALGTGAFFAIVTTTVSRWFVKKRGLVIGVVSASGGVGQIILAPFSNFLLSQFDWRQSFIILGLIVWVIVIPASLLMKRDPGVIGALPDGEVAELVSDKSVQTRAAVIQSGLTLGQAWKVREFWFLMVIWILSGIATQMVMTHVVPYVVDLGISAAEAALIISLIGLGSIAGRVIDGRLADSIGGKKPAYISAMFLIITLVSLIFIRQTWQFYIAGLLFGYGWGGLNTQVLLTASEVFGVRGMGAIVGTVSIGYNVGSAVGPAIGGVIFDVTGSYSTAFLTATMAIAAAAILFVLIRPKLVKAE
jgi:OFA family oxalate/formate antiporter-like MFS transporter